jgi:tetratricopeptide (TPR) repeat protein
MSTSKKKWWQIWKKRLKEPESELEKVTKTYKDIAKEHKKKQEFEIITVHQKIEAAYKIIVRVLIGLVAIGVIIGFIKEYQKDELVIEPFLVYDELKKQGFEGAVICSSIMDKINEIKEFANTSKETQAFAKQNSAKPIQVRLPIVGSGFSLNSVYEQAKSALGKPPKTISGSIMQYNKKISINLNILGKTFRKTLENDTIVLEKLIEYAATSIIKQTEPYLLAAYYIQKAQLDNAIETSRYCLSHEPKSDDKWAYLVMGRAEFMKGNELAAIEYTKKALHIDKKFPNALVNWGTILQTSRKNPNLEEALKKYKTAIEINPKYASAYSNWGSILLQQQKYGEALQKYKTAYSIEKDNKITLHRIGLTYQSMKKYDDAIEWYKKSIDVDAKYINAYWGILEATRDKKYGIDEDFLLDITEDALEINRNSIIPYFEGKVLFKYTQNVKFKEIFESHYKLVIKEKDAILEEGTDNIDAMLSLAISLREQKNYKEAFSIYEKLLETKEYESEVLYGILLCYVGMQKQDLAIETARKLIQTDTENKDYFYYNPVLIPYLVHSKLKDLFQK